MSKNMKELKTNGTSIVANFLKEILCEINQEYSNIIYKKKFDSGVSYVRFATRYLDTCFELYQNNDGVLVKNPNRRYFYEFCVRELKNESTQALKMNLVLDMNNLKETDIFFNRIKKICAIFDNKIELENTTIVANKEKYIVLNNAVQEITKNYYNEEFRTNVKNAIKRTVDEMEQKMIDYFIKEKNN